MGQSQNAIKLIFNPYSGKNAQSPTQLMQIESRLQKSGFVTESYLIEPGRAFTEVVKDAAGRGINRFVVCGGDGTVSAVARELCGSDATLGIIPTGTQNNIAYSLKIPFDIESAVSLLNFDLTTEIDIGLLSCGKTWLPFFEVCSVGLISSVFSAADEIQHGNLLRISDFIAELAKSKPAEFHMLIDGEYKINGEAYCIVISNMPYVFRHYEVGPSRAYRDGFLNVSVFADMTKLDLAGCAVKVNSFEDQRIQRFRARKIELDTFPEMPVMADGVNLGAGHTEIRIQKSSFKVITGIQVNAEIQNKTRK